MVRGRLPTWVGACAAVLLAGPGAVVAQPAVPGQPVRSQPAADYPLPTDGLMAPAPIVPPRNAYQRPPEPAAPRTGGPDFVLPPGTSIPLPGSSTREVRVTPRYGRAGNISSDVLPDGTRRGIYTGGVIITGSPGPNEPVIEFATDDAVIWIRNAEGQNPEDGVQIGPGRKTEVEIYLAGNVLIRTVSGGKRAGTAALQTVRADEVYYDVTRNRAIALSADLEIASPRLGDALHLKGREIRRLDLENWEVLQGSSFASKLPSDPGLRLDSPRVTLRERRVIRKNIFGIPYRTFDGEPIEGYERIVTARNSVTRLNGVPVMYFPYLRFDATDPLGPLLGVSGGYDRIFGPQIYTNWDVYKLLALRRPDGHRWILHLNYLGKRGGGVGTDYNYVLPMPEEGGPPIGAGLVRMYGMRDNGTDILGGFRGPDPGHPDYRGRVLWRHRQELDDVLEGLYFQGQFAAISDYNFLEQFYKNEWDFGPNQETFAYLTWQRRNVWASGLVDPRFARSWIAQTSWLPRVDGAVVGQSFWDTLVYSTRANAAYAQARASERYPGPMLTTDRNLDTGRFDLRQELALPFELGPVKLAPYGTLDLTYYTRDLTGREEGRVIGGGGVRGSVPFSRLYEDVGSELFNVRGLYHKAVVGANYYYARSTTPYTQLPMLDRLNDDAVDQGYRNMRPYQPDLLPGPAGQALAYSPIFDPQKYAIRRLVENRIDTLDSINVLQGNLRQRLQTKRGYPGQEHTVDWLLLDLSASYFPQPNRDNFGKPFAFLEYGALWNVGDRVAVQSNGWFDPFDYGARYWNVGVYLDRPDRTNFYVGYRQTDPINSKAVTASLGYQLNRRYYVSLGVSYDFGLQTSLSNTVMLTRTGSDLTFQIGMTYNALVNNFGVQFLVLPNLVNSLTQGRFGPLGASQFINR